MAKASAEDASILEYALKALEQERDHLQSKIDGIRRMIGARGTAKTATAPAPASSSAETTPKGRKKRVLSDAARKRIAAAQKRRWAEHRKSQAPAAKKSGAKRVQAAE